MDNVLLKYRKNAVIEMLRHLNAIVVSLDRIGSSSVDMPKYEYDRLSSEFLDEWEVSRRLSFIRSLLSEEIDYDELEVLMEDVPVWRFADRAPPASFRLSENEVP